MSAAKSPATTQPASDDDAQVAALVSLLEAAPTGFGDAAIRSYAGAARLFGTPKRTVLRVAKRAIDSVARWKSNADGQRWAEVYSESAPKLIRFVFDDDDPARYIADDHVA